MLTPSPRETSKGILLMLLAILTFTAMDAAAKGLIKTYPVQQVLWARFAGQVFFVLLLLRGKAVNALRTRYPVQHLLRSACQLGATGCFFAALPHIGLAEATALMDLNPVLITLGAALFLGEKLGPRRIAGVLAAMIGAMIVIRPGADIFTPAALLPLCGAVFYSANALFTRHLGPRESHWTPMLLAALFATVVMGLVQPLSWQPVAMADLPMFILLGALGTVAQLCLIRAFSMAEAGVVAPFAYTGILFATFWGFVLYDEWPDLQTIAGVLVIVSAGVYVWHRETRRNREI